MRVLLLGVLLIVADRRWRRGQRNLQFLLLARRQHHYHLTVAVEVLMEKVIRELACPLAGQIVVMEKAMKREREPKHSSMGHS